jgi:hypothetical protein
MSITKYGPEPENPGKDKTTLRKQFGHNATTAIATALNDGAGR